MKGLKYQGEEFFTCFVDILLGMGIDYIDSGSASKDEPGTSVCVRRKKNREVRRLG